MPISYRVLSGCPCAQPECRPAARTKSDPAQIYTWFEHDYSILISKQHRHADQIVLELGRVARYFSTYLAFRQDFGKSDYGQRDGAEDN